MYPWSSGTELDQVRERAATTLSASVDEIALTPSTTVALNMVGEGLVASGYLKPGANVLTTDQEHGGGLAVWLHWQNAGIIDSVDTVAVPYGVNATVDSVVGAFASSLSAAELAGVKYSVVSLSHVLTTTGLRLPLPELADLAHAHGALLVVDGAQAPGGIAVNLSSCGADVYTVSAHKWLLAPTGSGLLYVRSGSAQAAVTPTYLDGGFSAYTQSSGTVPLQTIAGLGYSFDFFEALGGLEAIEAHNMALRESCYQQLTQLVNVLLDASASHHSSLAQKSTSLAHHGVDSLDYSGLEIISPQISSGVASPIVSLNLPPAVLSNSDAVSLLASNYGVVVKLLPDFEGGNPFVVNAIRVSHHLFNDDADVAKLIAGLSALLEASKTTN